MDFIASKVKLLWKRVTFSRITTIYFLFSICHCVIQVTFQIQAFNINQQAGSFLSSILEQGNATDPNGFTVLTTNGLYLCREIPSTFSTQSCQVIWNGTTFGNDYSVVPAASQPTGVVKSGVTLTTASASSSEVRSPSEPVTVTSVTSTSNTQVNVALSTKTLTIFTLSTSVSTPKDEIIITSNGVLEKVEKRYDNDVGIIAATVNGQIQVNINGLGYELDRTCLWALNYPVDLLLNTKREDITFIAFQFWVLGMSVVALLNESIPHILASLLTHMLATAWAGFQIAHTADFKASFSRVATHGACNGVNLLPTYWTTRAAAEIPLLVLNCVALLVSSFLTWRLVKLFGWQTFKRVGASMTINRIYKLVLILSIVIQLSLFFMVVALALWIDQLWNGQIAHLATEAVAYRVIFISVLFLLIPWLATGWFAVRRELKMPMLIFLVLSFGYLAGWGAMFASATFRWTFVQWRFYSLITSGSAFLTLIAIIVGLICRMNFGKGLLRYLTQELIQDERTSVPYNASADGDSEKVNFPSYAQVIPTFSVAFGSGDKIPPPGRMFVGRQKGPRFFQESAVPFESPPEASHNTRSPSRGSLGLAQEMPLGRQVSRSSERSIQSSSSANTTSGQTVGIGLMRWQID